MKAGHAFITIILAVIVTILLKSVIPSFAEDNTEGLKKQIELLQKRVEELEAERNQEPTGPLGLFNRRRTQSWDPFEEMQRMQEEMDRMFQDSFSWGGPSSKGMFRSDMYYDDNFGMREEKDKYIIEFDMSGLNQKKIDVEINQESITVKGEYSEEIKEKQQNRTFSSKSYGTFLKSIPVPEDADTAKMKSEKKGNMFIVTLPKK